MRRKSGHVIGRMEALSMLMTAMYMFTGHVFLAEGIGCAADATLPYLLGKEFFGGVFGLISTL